MLKDLEEKLKSLTDEDKVMLSDLISPSKVDNVDNVEEPIKLAANLGNLIGGRGDGVMTIKAHQAYREATGESLLDNEDRGEKKVETYNPGKDSTLILEWKARNKARQDETLRKLLESRKKK